MRRAEGALPLPVGARKKSVTVKNLRLPLFLSTDEIQGGRLCGALPTVVRVRATIVFFIPVAYGRLAVDASRAVVRCQVSNILSSVMIVPKMQQA